MHLHFQRKPSATSNRLAVVAQGILVLKLPKVFLESAADLLGRVRLQAASSGFSDAARQMMPLDLHLRWRKE